MRRIIAVAVLVAAAGQAPAAGLLIPIEKQVPPLAMLNHNVNVTIDDQVAITRVEQTFRNHTDRRLEATYIFPVPKGASVRKFKMWVGGKEISGELVEAKKARQIYTSIVRRTKDPGLLEFMGHRLLRMRVFPIPPKSDQKIAFSYTSVVPKEDGLINFSYPLKTDGKAIQTLEKFSVDVTIKSQFAVQNIYSPSHPITVTRSSDKEAKVSFSKNEALLDRNFDLYYTAGTKDVGLTALTHRPAAGQKGFFMMLISPRAELSREQQIPRDIVFVLDTSGSMRGKRIVQAKEALNYCLNNLNRKDRFAIVQFATTINKYTNSWTEADGDNVAQAKKWVNGLSATGGTAINDALAAALQMRTNDKTRTFNIVFFTDGRPTIGETNSEKIVKNVLKRNSANTRIFTFGVGNDVNATMLDQISEESRAVSTYVRESETIKEKVTSLYNKVSHPVLANLKLDITGVKISDVYPPQLPDLFHGSQLVVLGRYDGDGDVAVKLEGAIGADSQQFTYETKFAKKTGDEKPFVEDLWARRKVGFLLDEIRRNGEKKELVDEVVALAKRYGITTPYTSYLIVPDAPTPVAAARTPAFRARPNVAFDLPGGAKATPGKPVPVSDFAKRLQKFGGIADNRGRFEEYRYQQAARGKKGAGGKAKDGKALKEAEKKKSDLDRARGYFSRRQLGQVQAGRLGVNLSVWNNTMRNQSCLEQTAVRRVQRRNVLEVGGVWIDENYDAKMMTVTIRAQSKAYFRMLQRHPELKDVYRLGNHLVWVTPNRTALIVDTIGGRTEMTDGEIDALFVKK